MQETSTLVRKAVIGLCDEHPGWSHNKIARALESERPDLVDDLFTDRRSYMLNQWVNQVVARHRVDQRDRLKSGDLFAAISPDGKGRLITLGDMTGTQAVELGTRYLAAGSRLLTLGEFYVKVGDEAGRRKVKNVFTVDTLEAMYQEHSGGHR